MLHSTPALPAASRCAHRLSVWSCTPLQERSPELAADANGKLITVPLEAANLCFFTTIVTAGSGRGMVIGTGDRWDLDAWVATAGPQGLGQDETKFAAS